MAYKTFANGFPLPASDLNNFLMNQSVIVFADSAARTTAIPSPVEGMLTYLEDTNAYESWNGSAFVNINDNTDAIPKSTVTTAQDLIVADGASSVTRLGVGADDQVLSVVAGEVAWADAGGGGGAAYTLISSAAFPTGAGTSTISGLSGYDNYFVFIDRAKVSGASNGGVRVNGITTGYVLGEINTDTNTEQFEVNSDRMSTMTFRSSDSEISVLAFHIKSASSSGNAFYHGTNTDSPNQSYSYQGIAPLTSALDSITLFVNSGTFTLFGNCRIYGA
jgi:hypothetical protein